MTVHNARLNAMYLARKRLGKLCERSPATQQAFALEHLSSLRRNGCPVSAEYAPILSLQLLLLLSGHCAR